MVPTVAQEVLSPALARIGSVGEANAAMVRDDVSHLDRRLAVLGEFRPVVGNRRFQVDQSAVGQDVDAQRARALGDRIEEAHGVFAPRTRAGLVHVAAPQIDDWLAPVIDADGAADLAAFGVPRAAHVDEGRQLEVRAPLAPAGQGYGEAQLE